MLAVADARRIVLDHALPLPPELTPLSSACLGRPLAEAVAADQDVPPFAKALMDGFAVRSADLAAGRSTLTVVEEVTAGRMPTRPLAEGQATRIMTGAPLPQGADAVVMIESCRLNGDRVELTGRVPRAGDNVMPQGQEMRRGETILSPGAPLTPQAFGVLSTCGRTAVWQGAPPRVAISATGDELIEPSMAPCGGQVRNSNAPMLLAQAAAAGALPRYLGIARDTDASLRAMVREGLETAEILLLSGGVSAGKLDLVPDVLRQEGVTAHFHKVSLKPGKPLFFGTASSEGKPRLVFGLPGNPVSSFVCFELFVRPAIRRLGGHSQVDLPAVRAALEADFSHRSDRPTYHPATLTLAAEGWRVRPLPWLGSADLRAFLPANALLVLPPGEQSLAAGTGVEALCLPT